MPLRCCVCREVVDEACAICGGCEQCCEGEGSHDLGEVFRELPRAHLHDDSDMEDETYFWDRGS